MSLLSQDPQSQPDDAALGESYTRGTSSLVRAAIAAAVLVSLAIAIYFFAGQRRPVATAEILDVWAHPMHTVTPGFDASGTAISQESFDQVLVFARVRLHNQFKGPLFLHQIQTNITLGDGVRTSFAASPSQYERVFLAYPELASWRATTLSTEQTLDTGQTAEGTFVSSFRMPRDQWEARRGLSFTFGFRYQPEVTVPWKGAVTDR